MIPAWLSHRPIVPANWDEVTPGWMTAALRRDHPDAVVSKVTCLTRDDGTNRRARFAIDYARGSGPAQVFVKAHAASHRWVHLRNGNLFNEARLFARGTALPLEHPRVFHAVPDYPRLDFLLVMEDLTTRDADPRDALRPLSPEQVASGLAGLARLHARFEQRGNRAAPGLGWVKPWKPSQGWLVGLRRRVPIGLERAGEAMPAEIRALGGDGLVDLWAANVASLATGMQTLLHGDAHIGNTYVLANGTTGFLDWQVVRRGNWVQDVGYFLVGALTVDDRRAHERELLAGYLAALEAAGGTAVDPGEAWTRYAQSPAYGLAIWLSTLGTDGWQRHEISLALAERYAAAAGDHGTLG